MRCSDDFPYRKEERKKEGNKEEREERKKGRKEENIENPELYRYRPHSPTQPHLLNPHFQFSITQLSLASTFFLVLA